MASATASSGTTGALAPPSPDRRWGPPSVPRPYHRSTSATGPRPPGGPGGGWGPRKPPTPPAPLAGAMVMSWAVVVPLAVVPRTTIEVPALRSESEPDTVLVIVVPEGTTTVAVEPSRWVTAIVLPSTLVTVPRTPPPPGPNRPAPLAPLAPA